MAADREYIRESNLDNVYKRMRQINEYVITNGHPNEADETLLPQDGDQMQDQQGGMQPQPDQTPQGNAQQAMPQDNNMEGGAMPNDSTDTAADVPPTPDPTIGAEAPDNGTEEDVEEIDMEGDGEGDEVIDVEDLTNSQESAEYKIDGVDDKLSKLLAIAGKFAKAIAANDEKLEDLKGELERRNPTDTEKINLRSQNSQPYNVNPGEYWQTVKEKNPNYQVVSDNEVSPNEEEKIYTIMDDDLKDFNTREIERSFSDFPEDLMSYFK